MDLPLRPSGPEDVTHDGWALETIQTILKAS
jgi:hypothetical protein